MSSTGCKIDTDTLEELQNGREVDILGILLLILFCDFFFLGSKLENVSIQYNITYMSFTVAQYNTTRMTKNEVWNQLRKVKFACSITAKCCVTIFVLNSTI